MLCALPLGLYHPVTHFLHLSPLLNRLPLPLPLPFLFTLSSLLSSHLPPSLRSSLHSTLAQVPLSGQARGWG